MSSSADEAREMITEQRKSMIEIDMRWLFRLADWLFSYPPRKPLFAKSKKRKKKNAKTGQKVNLRGGKSV